MTEVLDQPRGREALLAPHPGSEAPARRVLLDQIARLEAELGSLFCAAFPRHGLSWSVGSRAGPRLLSLGELEALRDDLAGRVAGGRRALAERAAEEERQRRRIEAMLLDPPAHRWQRVRNCDIGERGCKEYRVVPRLGPLGLLMGWWRVKVSSGCPLRARREAARE